VQIFTKHKMQKVKQILFIKLKLNQGVRGN
jgi:hypothetical protein